MASRALLLLFLAVVVAPSPGLRTAGPGPPDAPPPRRPRHVAVCFFGLTRSLLYTIGNVRSQVLDVLTLNHIKVTVYLHTYNVTILNNTRSKEVGLVTDPNVYVLLNPHRAVMDPPLDWQKLGSVMEQMVRHGDPWGQGEPHGSLRNLYAQLVSLERVTQMWQSDEDIDVAIYLRSDVWFFTPLNVSDLERAAAARQPAVWTPNFHTYSGMNDRFALGNRAGMRIYGMRRRLLEEYVLRRWLHAESFLRFAMLRGNVSTYTTDMLFTRVRSNRYIWEMPVYVDGVMTTNVTYVHNHRLVRNILGTYHLVAIRREGSVIL
eukprot:EG_transcript_13189